MNQGKQSRNETFHNIVRRNAEHRWCKILKAIRAAGSHGITCDELAANFECFPNQVSGRITELKAAGLVMHTARRRPTRSGGMASVIVVTEKGVARR